MPDEWEKKKGLTPADASDAIIPSTVITSYTAKISGNRFIVENITFVNSAGPVGQAIGFSATFSVTIA